MTRQRRGARNLGDQTVSAEPTQDAADFGACLFGVFPRLEQMGSGRQPWADIFVGKTAQTVIAVHDALE